MTDREGRGRETTGGDVLGFSVALSEIVNNSLDSLVFLLEMNILLRNFMILDLPFLV